MLYSPTSVFGRIKHLLVGLRIAQHHLNALCRYLLYRSAVYHLGAGVGHVALTVWIDYHDVALAEVGRVGSLFHVKPQSQTLHHTIGRESELFNRHFFIYIACCPFVLKCVEPDGRKSTVVLGLVAHLGKQMFAFHELKESEVVGALQFGSLLYGAQYVFQFGSCPFLPEPSGRSFAVEFVGSQIAQHIDAHVALRKIGPRQQIAHTYCAQRQFRKIGNRHQSFGIFRIEQHKVAQLVGVFLELVVEQGTI